jgi:hypothetical protein
MHYDYEQAHINNQSGQGESISSEGLAWKDWLETVMKGAGSWTVS